ncbi:sigma-54-dependent Fis family transcriptional regulator [Pseudoflavitalea sp. X16]|uniref:sigma-54-dependent transcriptional regulator n=1 Tax=Paraflavitalea devenefica TaxID=2716334 RepID=UPI00141E0591|nr:sigma-54 dependent transcriptional regulator [Paraflavitalea devenefica]NII24838.1 sigma-54-dependent Fis family transcriptional regulator [Paraflavitalea devenefica]
MKNQHALRIFVLEDDVWYGSMLEHYLSLNPDYEVKRFESSTAFFNQLHERPNVVTLDYSMPDMDGSAVLKKIREVNPDIQVIIISGQEDVGTAINLLKNGAFDYIVKDDEVKDRLWNSLLHLKEIVGLRQEVEHLKEQVGKKYDYSKYLIGKSESMDKVYGLIEKACKTNITVSIAGETGTGKEMVAKAIHYNSERQKKPFVAVNVAAIPKELIESELFGHEKGAFTGAVTRRLGKFEEANGGTLFLDEIGEMDISLQAKLLRVLQEREITRIGGNEVVPVNARIIVATHRNLLTEVQNKTFREDLYYRLIGLPIQLPALRERGNDIILLARYFLDLFCKDNGIEKKTISPEVQQKLLQYTFPGNVRELKSVMELAAVMADGDIIQPEHITINTTATVNDLLSKERTLKDFDIHIIQHYLDKYDKDVLLVAKKLDIGKSTIYRMIQAGELTTK